MRCIIIDDEQLIRELLEDNIGRIPFLQLVKSCRNATEAIEALETAKVDLIFLDINMPGLNGLQFLESLLHPPLVIIVSAYEEYALKGFELSVVDYILKPFTLERFMKACMRANGLFKLKTVPSPVKDEAYLFVNVEYTQVRLAIADISFIEGLKDYVKIFTTISGRPVLTRMTMKAAEQKLASSGFIRTHKSFLVAARKITVVKRDYVCVGEREIPVGEYYKQNITRLLLDAR